MRSTRNPRVLYPSYPRTPALRVDDSEQPVNRKWLASVVSVFLESISDLTGLIEDTSHRVDEYQVQDVSESVTQVTWLPVYDSYSEIITAIVVNGPVASPTFTLQLGKRKWTLTLPASQILVIAPVKLSLDRNDARLLTSTTAGNWSVELMGHADIGYRYK